MAPDRPGEWPGAELRVVALFGEKLFGRVGDLDLDLLAFEVFVELGEHDVHDLQHVLFGKRVEDDDLVYPVEELGPEGLLQRIPGLPLGVGEVNLVARVEAELLLADEVLAADVGGHNNDRVLEADRGGPGRP